MLIPQNTRKHTFLVRAHLRKLIHLGLQYLLNLGINLFFVLSDALLTHTIIKDRSSYAGRLALLDVEHLLSA